MLIYASEWGYHTLGTPSLQFKQANKEATFGR